MFGQAAGSIDDGYHDAALVITDVTADGEISEAATVPLDGESPPPCGIWSAGGRWVAFGVDLPLVQGPEDAAGMNPRDPSPVSVDEVWVIDTQSDDIRRLRVPSVTDLDWAPDSTELALAANGVSLSSVTDDETRPLGGAGAASLAWSPDGQIIAFVRNQALFLMDADGTNERILVPEFDANHGLGPVWSPDGDRIAYQRLCDHPASNPGAPCREEHEVVLVTVNENAQGQPAGTQEVIPPPLTTGPDGPIWWYPWSVTWSPDGTALLYLAWPEAQPMPTIPHSELVAVPVDGETPPVVLSGDLQAAVYSGFPWLPIQSWGRQPDG